MKGQGSYVPPPYIPLGQSDSEVEIVPHDSDLPDHRHTSDSPSQWSSGICACCDDMQSCCIGFFCPCFLFAKNAEFLGSGTLAGSCMTHLIFWALVNTVCCLLSDGTLLGLPGCFVACYACGYRRALRSKYNLQYIVLKGPRHPQGAEAFQGMSTKCNQGMHLSEMRCTLRRELWGWCFRVQMNLQILSRNVEGQMIGKKG
ncbi:Protein plant cadmium resistance 10 [Vitis vinifera]|uniref:Protein plant cadmium resistance 10 n=1 Tax=Vitis vinifera TaxID=29760 RepID=A0A438FNU6_VITVI|nr:Protein plant cadmium resistance 10 [Vitis vinifera]